MWFFKSSKPHQNESVIKMEIFVFVQWFKRRFRFESKIKLMKYFFKNAISSSFFLFLMRMNCLHIVGILSRLQLVMAVLGSSLHEVLQFVSPKILVHPHAATSKHYFAVEHIFFLSNVYFPRFGIVFGELGWLKTAGWPLLQSDVFTQFGQFSITPKVVRVKNKFSKFSILKITKLFHGYDFPLKIIFYLQTFVAF